MAVSIRAKSEQVEEAYFKESSSRARPVGNQMWRGKRHSLMHASILVRFNHARGFWLLFVSMHSFLFDMCFHSELKQLIKGPANWHSRQVALKTAVIRPNSTSVPERERPDKHRTNTYSTTIWRHRGSLKERNYNV